MTADVAVDDPARYRRLRDAAEALMAAVGPMHVHDWQRWLCRACGRASPNSSLSTLTHDLDCPYQAVRDELAGDES